MKKILLIISFFITFISYAQTVTKWSDLFSYNNVLVIREDNGRLIAATENGVFYYTPGTGEIKKLSKANGLHDVKISAFDYNAATQTGIIGYQNGSMDVITPNGIFLIVDIPLATGYNGSKRINHISINGDRAVVSAGYGVSIFNITRREFGDTAFFATGGVYTEVKAAVLKDNTVYAATASGIKSHEINSTFPVFTTWTTALAGNFKKVDAKGVSAFATATQVFYGAGPSFGTIPRTFTNVQDVLVTDSQIIVSDQNQVYVYSTGGAQQKNFNAGEDINTALISGNALFTGTKISGIYNEQKNSLKPDGPFKNNSYKLSLLNGQIWVSTGGRTAYNDPLVSGLGYYHFNGSNWIYPDLFKNNTGFNVLDVVPNPADPSEVFFTNNIYSSATKGIYKMKDDGFVKKYLSEGNTFATRLVGLTFDSQNRLFCSATALEGGGASTGYYLYNASADTFSMRPVVTIGGVQRPVTKDGVLYIPAPFYGDGGLVIYNYNNTPDNVSDDSFKVLKTTNNLPVNGTVSVAVDNNDDVWIGTREGLRILSNPKSAILEDTPQTEDIIIEENGLAEELFRDATILQVAVDTGNQKWISVEGGGVFYISSNGDKTFYHFTKANSPLPNDTVTDIQIDNKTGKVYFATLDGIMVYQGDVGEVTSNFGNVLVYPNPVVYAQYKGNVRIRGLASKTNIRITDAAGNLVHSAVANGGYFEWNLANQRGTRVASGIYYVLMTNEDGTDTATAKIAVVN